MTHTLTLSARITDPAITAALACGYWTAEHETPAGALRLTGHGGGIYSIYERLRPLGWRIVEASDDDMPYGAALVHDEGRATLTYAEGDLCLTVCPTAELWAAELMSLSAFYGAPILAALGWQAPAWDFTAEEPRVSAELEETWHYACNDGNCYRDFMAAVRPLVRAYLRGQYTASMGAPVFAALLREAASRYRREFRCAFVLNADEVAAWSMYEADRLTLRLWRMRRGAGIGWRGVEAVLHEECAALREEAQRVTITPARKYDYVQVIRGNFGPCGWEDVAEYARGDAQARADLKEYRASGQGLYKLVERRVLREGVTA